MEWKIIVGQICLTAITISCILTEVNHGLIYAAMGALATSIGIPYIIAAKEISE